MNNKTNTELKEIMKINRKFKNRVYWIAFNELNNRYNMGIEI